MKSTARHFSVRQRGIAACLGWIILALPNWAAPKNDFADLAKLDFREVVRQSKDSVFPTVVFIKCVRESHEHGKKQFQEVAGSGVLISPQGEILSNWHVVDKATEIRCLLFDGRAFYADTVGADKDLDLALIRLRLPDAAKIEPYAALGDSSKLKEGDFVMAMGAPWGLTRSVSIGIVACTRRYLKGNSEYSLWLQTDASISPGNSGGPLVSTAGEVVGINTMGAIFGGDLGFAVPSATIREVLPRLREHGDADWSWTGLEIQAIRDFNRNVYFEGSNGVIVASVVPGGPAQQAGIRDRDRILAVNGLPVNGYAEEDLPAIRRMFGLLPVGQPAAMEVRRGDEKLAIAIVPRRKGKVEGTELDCPRWDLTIKAINQFDNKDLYFYRKEGVFIFAVRHPGNASTAGLMPRDIILEIDGANVATVDQLKDIHGRSLADIGTRTRVLLKVLRNGTMRQVILDFARDYEKE
ncbi:MAG: trypsin-like peptidase domain-containing protein [Lentisphaerae bacterium]|nr:trypsin-like peptidase domain-containing protein [Lentisphaerota bacterium]